MASAPTVVILGAGEPQIPAIERAKRLGYRVVCPDVNPEAPGLKLADYPLPGVSTRDPAALIEALRAAGSAGFAARGLLTMAVEASHSAARIGYPVVLKPTQRAGSAGVVRCTSEQNLRQGWTLASAAGEGGVLIEEFLEGTEHSSESLVVDGKIYTTGFSDRNYDAKHRYPPHFLEDGDTLPTILPPPVLERTLSEARRAIEALGIRFGPAKADILATREGRPYILEMATRLSGDYFCSHTVPLHNGTDILGAALQQCVGDVVELDLLKPRMARGVALRYLWPGPLPGVIRSIDGWERCAALPDVHFLKWEPHWSEKRIGVGTRLTAPTSHRERVASVMATGQDRDAAVSLAEQVVRSVRIEVQPDSLEEVRSCPESSRSTRAT